MRLRELLEKRAALLDRLKGLLAKAEGEGRDLSDAERGDYDAGKAELDALNGRVARAQELRAAEQAAGLEQRAADGGDAGGEGREWSRLCGRYSLLRAVAATVPNSGVTPGVEGEVAAELRQRQPARKWRGLPVPDEALRVRASDLPAVMEQRATVSDMRVGAGNALAADRLRPDLFIDVLRPSLVSARLGVRILDDLAGAGKVSIPRGAGAVTVVWVNEDEDVSSTHAGFNEVELSPRTVGGALQVSRRLLLTSSPSVEALLRADLAAAIARAVDAAMIAGDTAAKQPKGLLRYTAGDGVSIVPMGTNGAAPDWGKLLAFRAALSDKNADPAVASWLSNSKVGGKLAGTLRVAGDGGSGFVLDYATPAPQVLGRPWVETGLVPSNLSKGTGNNLSGLVYGDFSEVILGRWSGFDLVIDPYTQALNGAVRIVMLHDVDIAVRQPGAFAISSDVATA